VRLSRSAPLDTEDGQGLRHRISLMHHEWDRAVSCTLSLRPCSCMLCAPPTQLQILPTAHAELRAVSPHTPKKTIAKTKK
jgi:hypothetical protein